MGGCKQIALQCKNGELKSDVEMLPSDVLSLPEVCIDGGICLDSVRNARKQTTAQPEIVMFFLDIRNWYRFI